ncbi:MAG: GAF domain-containing protein, partial [Acidobacteriota bacterium]
MSNQVLIVASEADARVPAEVVRSLQFTPVIVATAAEALALIDRQEFAVIAMIGNGDSRSLRDACDKRPSTSLLHLRVGDAGEDSLRRQLKESLQREQERPRFTEDRYRFLSSLLEFFTNTLDLREVVRRIVTTTRQELGADRAWLLHPVNGEAETARIVFSVNSADCPAVAEQGAPVPLGGSRPLIRRALESSRPIVAHEGEEGMDPVLMARYNLRSELVQILRPQDDEPWAFGLHQCSSVRQWTEEEIELFGEIGRYATLALNNTLLHDRAVREMAKVNAILDQIPESAAIYDASGKLERTNAAAQREPSQLFTPDA